MIQEISESIWRDKYRYNDEVDLTATRNRVINGVYANDPNKEAREEARALIHKGLIVPAGRIMAGAGTTKRVTLVNCFVGPTIQDSMDTIPSEPGKGLMDSLKDAALTQQMGGGIGMNFSTVRPKGALVKRTGSVSSGVLPFMDMWNAMCSTVMSSGSRRGAMMGTLAIWHPDILDFVVAKQTEGRLTNFNVSVLVTDDFMEALANDENWDLHFSVPRADGEHVEVINEHWMRAPRYVYKRIKARALWDAIIENTYIHAEPGVIFIDRANKQNNLAYVETLECCNPCGEQLLPANGDCNLGHVNLAEMVRRPFERDATFNWGLLDESASAMVRLLDNVIDITQFPTEEQSKEGKNKRRIGLGYTGLANALQMLGIRYGSDEAVKFVRQVGKTLAYCAYSASIDLAIERGPFPLFNADKYCASPFVKNLPPELQDSISKHGIRNGVLLSIAPTGTTSMLLGNVSSGIEPVFMYEYDRKVLQPDGSLKKFDTVYDYGYLEWSKRPRHAGDGVPAHFVTAHELGVSEHLAMQAAAQEFIDSAVSKTINCPTEMTFEEFRDVYDLAYKMGLKGCTTYRPDPRSQRGSVLSAKEDKPTETKPEAQETATQAQGLHGVAPMQEVLEGRRYRIQWPGIDAAFYVCLMDYIDQDGVRRPFEIFISTKSTKHEAFIKALTRMVSAVFRREDDVRFVAEELQQVQSPEGGMFYQQRYVPSIVAMIGVKIEEHLRWLGLWEEMPTAEAPSIVPAVSIGERCEQCDAPAVIHEGGCLKCTNCGHSKCG